MPEFKKGDPIYYLPYLGVTVPGEVLKVGRTHEYWTKFQGHLLVRGNFSWGNGNKWVKASDCVHQAEYNPENTPVVTIKMSELKRLQFCNSEQLPKKIIHAGEILEWVSIGWVVMRKATQKDVNQYPMTVEG